MPCARRDLGEPGRLGHAGGGDLEQTEAGRMGDADARPASNTSADATNSSASAPRSFASSFTAGWAMIVASSAVERCRHRLALAVQARVDLPVVHVPGLGSETVAVLDCELHRRERRPQLAGQHPELVGRHGVSEQDPFGVQVVEHRAVGRNGQTGVSGRVGDLGQPPRRAAGDENDHQPGIGGRLDRSPAAFGHRAVTAQQRAVQIGGDHPDGAGRNRHEAVSTSRPPSNGRNATGTYTEPSGC